MHCFQDWCDFLHLKATKDATKKATIQTKKESYNGVNVTNLPNSYHSKPTLPSQCQMDPASNCCLVCLSLRLLLFLGMNELVTPVSNLRELVRVKMLKIKYS